MRKVCLYQDAIIERSSQKTAIVKTSVLKITMREPYLIRFTHSEIDVLAVTTNDAHVVESRFSEIGTH